MMRTLQEFQNEVLAPLRKERDEKMNTNYQKVTDASLAAAKAREQCDADKRDFLKKQRAEREVFEGQLEARRAEIFLNHTKAVNQAKIERRNINEDYNNQVHLACAEYNKDRVAAGEVPLMYFSSKNTPKGEREEVSKNEEDEE